MSLKPRRHFLYPLPTPKPLPSGKVEQHPLRSNGLALAGLAFLMAVVLLSLASPWLAPADPMAVDVDRQLQPPDLAHLAGTDLFGRDICSRLLHGGRLTLGIAALATLIATLPGIGLGLLAGFYDGWPDTLISRANDVLLTIPYLLLALSVMAILGPGPLNVALAIGLAGIAGTLRVARAAVNGTRKRPYVMAAHAVGCRPGRILVRHILPNVSGPLLVIVTLQLGWALLNVAALNFLGVGVEPGQPEWGAMLNEGRGFIRQAPWIAAAPGSVLTLVVLAVNLVGDGLRDAIDPHLKV